LEQLVRNIHEDLIAQCKQGSEAAHSQLYRLYSKAMLNTAFRITGNDDDAKDVLQEAFISAFRHLDYYRGDSTFGAWLKRIVVNKAITVLQKKKFEPLPENENWDVSDEADHSQYMEGLSVERVKKCIHELPDGYRSVLSLYLLEGYDHQEIAEIMHITESTSKSQLNRAKAKLREMLVIKTKKENADI
jgi:RNA polymerase sigma factor (sigma-70 family)